MYEFQMQRAAPSKILVTAMDLLLFFTEHEPVEGAAYEIHHDG